MFQRTLTAFGMAALLSPLAALALFNMDPGLDPVAMHFAFHFWAVSATSGAAAIACVVIILSARTLRETRLLFLALAFASIAGIFAVHGLMTPGFIANELYASVPVSGWTSVILGAVFVALSAVAMPPRVDAFIRNAGSAIFAWAVLAIGVYMLLSFQFEHWLDWVPTSSHLLQYAIAFVSMALFAFAIHRYWQAYQFAR